MLILFSEDNHVYWKQNTNYTIKKFIFFLMYVTKTEHRYSPRLVMQSQLYIINWESPSVEFCNQ